MAVFLWVLIVMGVIDMAGRAYRLHTGIRTVSTSDIIFNMFFNLIIMIWAALLLGGQP